MNFHILTLFPDMVVQGLGTSITGRAIEGGTISLEAVNIRDFSTNKHKKVDDYPYGGGAGMLMQAQPVFNAYESVTGKIPNEHKKRVIYVTPQGKPFTQQMAEEFAKSDDLIFLCGHYEGIDERVLEEVVTDYVSIGDYVLTGGELAAMVMIDAISRLVPGVLHNEVSAETESFHGELLEHPQYSRPEIWHNKAVPQVLLSGNQKKIDAWRLEESVKRTRQRRPDLYERYEALQSCKEQMSKQKLVHIDMIELINRGRAMLIAREGESILLKDKMTDLFYHSGKNTDLILSYIRENKIKKIIVHEPQLADTVQEELGLGHKISCYQAVYTNREKMSVSGLYRPDGQAMENGLVIRPLTMEYLKLVADSYSFTEDVKEGTAKAPAQAMEYGAGYLASRIRAGAMFGAFFGDALAGYIGIHDDGSMGMLQVFEAYRRQKVAKALETYLINYSLALGQIPYGQIAISNEASVHLQQSLGLHLSKTPVCWIL